MKDKIFKISLMVVVLDFWLMIIGLTLKSTFIVDLSIVVSVAILLMYTVMMVIDLWEGN